MKKYLLIGFLLLCFFFAPQVLAAESFQEELGLFFSHPDSLELIPSQQLLPGFRLLDTQTQEIRYDIKYRNENLTSVLEDVQLRLINTQTRSNNEFLEKSAIELVGITFDTSEPMKVLIVPHLEGSLQLASFGNSLTEYQGFLAGIQKPRVFGDVTGHPLQDEIEKSFEKGIFTGYEGTGTQRDFHPNEEITRAAFMKVMVLAADGVDQELVDDEYSKRTTGKIFSDVEDETWFAPYISFAANKGWVDGYSDGSFRPAERINAAEASKILLNSQSIKTITDADVWYRPYFRYWTEKNILVGDDDLFRFSFDEEPFLIYEPVKRSTVAGFLMRLQLVQSSVYSVFGREKGIESLEFSFGNDELKVFELGRPARSLRATNTYDIRQNTESIGMLFVYNKSDWIALEKETGGSALSQVYTGETTTDVYAFQPLCQEKNCGKMITKSFILTNQDLVQVSDDNLSFLVWSRDVLTPDVRIDQNLETLELKNRTEEVALFSLFEGRGKESGSYNNMLPLKKMTMGGKTWNLYEGDRVTLTTAIGSDLMVLTLRNISSFDEVSDNVKLMMRTVKGMN